MRPCAIRSMMAMREPISMCNHMPHFWYINASPPIKANQTSRQTKKIVGELNGGSQREERLDYLERRQDSRRGKICYQIFPMPDLDWVKVKINLKKEQATVPSKFQPQKT
ncbi:asparagine--tRNA ligase [Striga asiatica]|uniref:Asparagine--tRNA ligase n=1 Tax=Striga asiatica TaxID=4170 RepID=A0A5A7QLC3_STRAF|nr:asparagine--tRNA ligase [Striga asiatica]